MTTMGSILAYEREQRAERDAKERLERAAPDLLAASERALELLRSITDLPSELAPFRETAARALAEAIAKATGGDL